MKPIPKTFKIAWTVIIASCFSAAASGLSSAEDAPRKAAPFGFKDLEIYRASHDSNSLRLADMNGDGRMDIVYAHNADTSIRLLLQEGGGAAASAEKKADDEKQKQAIDPAASQVNEVQFDKRFHVEKIYTEKKIFALEVGELNGDGKPDLAYYGDPRELVVINQGGEWGTKTEKFPITDGMDSSESLRIADLDRDGLADLALLGKGKLYLIKQRAGGSLAKPEVYYCSRRNAPELYVVDVNGDGERDLVTVEPQSERPVVVRFQRHGNFGPEISQKMLPIIHARFDDLNGDGAAELIAIQGQTRRLIVQAWKKREAVENPGASPSPSPRGDDITDPRFVAFNPEVDTAQRRVVFGDVNGDKRTDILVTYGETAEAEAVLQNEQGELARPVSSPTLSDVRGVALGDFDGDGHIEVAVASGQEKVLGFSRWIEAGRISAPRTVPLEEEPILLARCPIAASLKDGASPKDGLYLLSRAQRSGQYLLKLLTLAASGDLQAIASVNLEAGANPNGLEVLDANGDGWRDCLVFIPFEDPRLFLLEGKDPKQPAFRDLTKEKDFGIGQLSKLAPRALSVARFPMERGQEGGQPDDLLVTSKSHARALRLNAKGQLQFLEQFSGKGAVASLQGSVAIDLDGDADLEVLLFDKSAASMDILDRGARGVYQTVKSIPMPGFELQSFAVEDLNGDGIADVAAVGKDSIALFYRGRDEFGFVEIAQFDPGDENFGDVKNYGRPEQAATGDLNGDGVREILLATEPKYFLTFLRSAKEGPLAAPLSGALQPALRFQIFEEKSYMRDNQSYGPREMAVADLNGDKKDDLVMLIHERILLYVQD